MQDTIRFRLNDRSVEAGGLPGTTSLLTWLREHARLTGTRDGCAEGDCGACTVAVLLPRDGAPPVWRAVDACLLFLPMLHGRHVVTVEGLREPGVRDPDAGWHPIQRALVEARASQCGFCTPGVAMTLLEACHRDDLDPHDDRALDEQLAGNLCRCTGYRPIREAARAVAGSRPSDRFTGAEGPAAAVPLAYEGGGQVYLQPGSLADLFAARARHPEAVLVAGGTDVALDVARSRRLPSVVIGLEAVPEIRVLRREPDRWIVGAGVDLTTLQDVIHGRLPALEKMLRTFGARQIRNRGTVGGNLCTASPVGDLAPVLLALDAVAVAVRPGGERTVPLHAFFPEYRRTALAPDEVLLRVEVPDPPPGSFASACKVSKRRELDIAAVSAGLWVDAAPGGPVRGVRLAFGGVAPTPVRAWRTEGALLGGPWTAAAVIAAADRLDDDLTPISDIRGEARYRRLLARRLLLGFALESLRPDRDRLRDRPTGTVTP